MRLCHSKDEVYQYESLLSLDADDFRPRSTRTVHRNSRIESKFISEGLIEDDVSPSRLLAVYGEGLKTISLPLRQSAFLRSVLDILLHCPNHEEESHAPNGSDCPKGTLGIPTLLPANSPIDEGINQFVLGTGLRVGSHITYRPPAAASMIDYRIGKVLYILASYREKNVYRVNVLKYHIPVPDEFTPRTIMDSEKPGDDHLQLTKMDCEEVEITNIICILDIDGIIGHLRSHPEEKIYKVTE